MTPFTSHSAVVTVPRLPSAEPVQQFRSQLSRDLFAFGAEMIKPHVTQLGQHNLDAEAEQLTEGRVWPQRIDRDNA